MVVNAIFKVAGHFHYRTVASSHINLRMIILLGEEVEIFNKMHYADRVTLQVGKHRFESVKYF